MEICECCLGLGIEAQRHHVLHEREGTAELNFAYLCLFLLLYLKATGKRALAALWDSIYISPELGTNSVLIMKV